MKKKKIVSTLLALLLFAGLPVSALAATWDIGNGDITVNAGSGGQTVTQGSQVDVPDSAPVITGSSKENNVTINADSGQTASVTLSGVNIDVRDKGKAAVSTTGEGNVSIELNGGSTLRSGYEHAGLEKNNGGSLTIGDENKDGKLTAEGGKYGAGIGGGYYENGSDITITGGEVKATGGEYGAGIGGGDHGNGSDITITGGKVKATGGRRGAGIGGGNYRIGKDITISGGEVNAIGGVTGAGIGGGCYGDGNNITVSGDAKLKVQGGVKDKHYGAGAGIGNGGKYGNHGGPNGAEVEPDICELNPSGKIEYYAPGADMEKDKPTSTTTGKPTEPTEPTEPGKPTEPTEPTEPGKPTEPIEPAVPEQPEAERGMDAPLYFITDRDGRAVRCRAERKGGVLTVTVDEDFAVLTSSLSGMTALRARGVEKIIFVTNGAKTAVKLSTIISKLTANGVFRLTHDGKAATFTLG